MTGDCFYFADASVVWGVWGAEVASTKLEGGGSETNETVIRQAVPDSFNMAIRRKECCL